jgi:hypothetical protein
VRGEGAEPVRSGACTDDCGANSVKRTTTRSWLVPSMSNLALFKNEDGAGLKLDKSLIGPCFDGPYISVIACNRRFYSVA